MRILRRGRQPGGGTGWDAVRQDRTRGRRGRRACRLAGPRSDRCWRMPWVRRRGNRQRWRCAGGRPRVGGPRTLPGLAWCERTRRNPGCSTASSGSGEARSRAAPVTCSTGGIAQTGPARPFRHEPGLGCDGGLCLCRTGGLTRIRRRTYISFHPPDSGWVTSRHRREVKRGTRCHGRRTDERRSPCAPCERLLHGVCCRRSALLLCWQLTPEPSSRSARVCPFVCSRGFLAYRLCHGPGSAPRIRRPGVKSPL